jgi:hypothetical protein
MLIRSEGKQWHQSFIATALESPAIHGMHFDGSLLAIAMACGGVGVTLESTRLPSVKQQPSDWCAAGESLWSTFATSAITSSFRTQVTSRLAHLRRLDHVGAHADGFPTSNRFVVIRYRRRDYQKYEVG